MATSSDAAQHDGAGAGELGPPELGPPPPLRDADDPDDEGGQLSGGIQKLGSGSVTLAAPARMPAAAPPGRPGSEDVPLRGKSPSAPVPSPPLPPPTNVCARPKEPLRAQSTKEQTLSPATRRDISRREPSQNS